MFSNFQKDRVTVHRENGEKYENQAASVQGDRIFMSGFKQLIEVGDLIERHMSNGGVETYEVVNPGWHEASGEGAIPAGYQMRVRKAGVKPANDTVPTQTVSYHFYGHNSRVNNNSVDNSANVVVGGQGDNEALTTLIDVMRSALESGEVLGEIADELKADLATLQAQASSPKPKWQVIKAAAGSIKAVLENMSGSLLASQALPYLAQLLK